MADLALNCPKCGGAVSVPIEEDVKEYVCTHCGSENNFHDDMGLLGGDFKDPLIGALISEWEIQEKVGEGGFGSVYRAYDKNLQRAVAMKVMLPSLTSNLEFVQKFIREAITAAQLNHPNIVGIHRVGRDEERNLHFLVMEFLEGKTLSDVIEESGEFPVDEAILIISQCSDALAVAHDKNIIHRDIKPENLMMDASGVVKITDFGLAKTMSTDQKSTKVMGTPHYMSPEQFEGKAVDGRTDIYSLGVTFYYMLSKSQPYEGTNTVQIIYSILTQDPKPVMDLNPEVPEEIWRIIKKMIAKDSSERYENFREVRTDLTNFQEGAQSQKVVCPSCEASNVRGRRFCRECGASLQIRCPHCGSEELAGTKHCGECGANVENLIQIRENLGRGEKLRAFGDLKRALGFYQEVLQLDPDHKEAHEATAAIRTDLKSIEDKKARVDALVEEGNAEGALAEVDGLMSNYPKVDEVKTYGQTVRRSLLHRVVDAHILHAEQCLQKGELDDALEAYEKALGVDPNRSDVAEKQRDLKTRMAAMAQTLAAAETALTDGRHEDALRSARDVLNLKPDHPRATEIQEEAKRFVESVVSFVNEARELIAKSEFDQAISRLQTAAEISPGDGSVQSLLAEAIGRRDAFDERIARARRLLADGALDEAESEVKEALVERPGDAAAQALKRELDERLASRAKHLENEALVKEGLDAEQRGDLKQAKKCLNRALTQDPENDAAVIALERLEGKITESKRLRTVAASYADKGEYGQAAATLNELAELLPGDRSVLEEAEAAQQKQDSIDAALENASQAVAAKNFEAALGAAEKVLALSPQNRAALNYQREAVRGTATIEKHLDEARGLIESELFDDALELLGKAGELGAPANAVERLRDAAEEGKVLLLKSEATRAFEFKDFKGAQERFSQIIELGKDDPDAAKGLKLAGKMISRGERETVLPKLLMVAASLAVLFLLQFQAIQGESTFDEGDPVLMALAEIQDDEAAAGRDPESQDPQAWAKVRAMYDEKIKELGEKPEFIEGRKFAIDMGEAAAIPKDNTAARQAAYEAIEDEVGTDPVDAEAARRRTAWVKAALEPIDEALLTSFKADIARAAELEREGEWQAARDLYTRLLNSEAASSATSEQTQILEAGGPFCQAMVDADAKRGLDRLTSLSVARRSVGDNPLMRKIRLQAINADRGATGKAWIAETRRNAGTDWSALKSELQKALDVSAVNEDPVFKAEVSKLQNFAESLMAAQTLFEGGRFEAALEVYTEAKSTEDASAIDRRAVETGRQAVIAGWKNSVKARIRDFQDGGEITPDQYWQKIITELADMSRVLNEEALDLFRDVSGD